MRLELIEYGFELLSNHRWSARLYTINANRVLRGDARDRACAMDSKGGESLEISLNACTPAAVRAGDGESEGYRFSFRHGSRVALERS